MADIERIKAVVALIEEDEQEHDGKHFNMDCWVTPPEDPSLPAFCNTQMCFAGWAMVHKVGGIVPFLEKAVKKAGPDGEDGEEWVATSWGDYQIEGEAWEYLDLDGGQAHSIFYRTAIETVEELKQHITDVLEQDIWPGIEIHPIARPIRRSYY